MIPHHTTPRSNYGSTPCFATPHPPDPAPGPGGWVPALHLHLLALLPLPPPHRLHLLPPPRRPPRQPPSRQVCVLTSLSVCGAGCVMVHHWLLSEHQLRRVPALEAPKCLLQSVCKHKVFAANCGEREARFAGVPPCRGEAVIAIDGSLMRPIHSTACPHL